jgi:hypothetical protein
MPLSATELRWAFLEDVADQTAPDAEWHLATREMKKVAERMLRETGTEAGSPARQSTNASCDVVLRETRRLNSRCPRR